LRPLALSGAGGASPPRSGPKRNIDCTIADPPAGLQTASMKACLIDPLFGWDKSR
jgi:hypothetical protein